MKNLINSDWIYNQIRYKISSHPSITIKFIKENINLCWCWKGISANTNIDMDFIKENLDKSLSWKNISQNESIKSQDYLENPDYDWDFNCLTIHPNFPIDVILKFPNLDYGILSSNPNLNLETVINLPDKNWDYRLLVLTHEFTLIEIETILNQVSTHSLNWGSISENTTWDLHELVNRDYPITWQGISRNPYLTFSLVKNCNRLISSSNLFLVTKNLFTFSERYYGAFQYSDEHMEKCQQNLKLFKEELIVFTWNPSRIINWCLDTKLQKDLNLIS